MLKGKLAFAVLSPEGRLWIDSIASTRGEAMVGLSEWKSEPDFDAQHSAWKKAHKVVRVLIVPVDLGQT